MADLVTTDQLRVRRLAEERRRALATVETELNQVIYHLRVAAHYNQQHNLQLELPREEQLLAAMNQCARIHQLDKEQQR